MDLPPPYAVRKPKQTTTSGVVLYILASASRSSLLGTLGRPGWSTSTTYEGEGEQVCDVCQWLPCTVMDEQTKLNVQVIDTTLYSLQTYQLKVRCIAYEPIHFSWTTSKRYQPLTNGSQLYSSPQVGPPVSLQDQPPFSLPFASAAGGGWSGTSEFVMYRSPTMFKRKWILHHARSNLLTL